MQLLDGAPDFVVLAEQILGAYREKPFVERRRLADVGLGSGDAVHPVARAHFPVAARSDLIEVFRS